MVTPSAGRTAPWFHGVNTSQWRVSQPLLVTDPIKVMDLAIAPVSEADVAAIALDGVRERRGGWICPINLDVLRNVMRNPEQRALVEQADVLTADGMPLIWASRVQRTPLPERVSGSS